MTSNRSAFALTVAGLAIIVGGCSNDATSASDIQDFELGTSSQSSIGSGERLTIVDATNGEELGDWTLPIGTRPDEMVTIGDTMLFPYMENASGTGVVALKDGSGPLWQHEVPGYGFGSLQVLGDDVVLGVVAYEDAYEGEQDPLGESWLARLDAKTGESIWSSQFGTLEGLAIHNENVLIAVDGEILALDGASGEQVWSTDFGFEIGPIVIDGQILAIGTDLNGKTRYIVLDEEGSVVSDLALDRYSSIVDLRGTTLIFNTGNRTFAYNIESGEQAWTTRGQPVYAGGEARILVTSTRVKAIDEMSGERLWRTPSIGGPIGSVATTDDRVYAVKSIGDDDKQLLAFTTGPNSAIAWKTFIPGPWASTAANDELVAVGGDGFVNGYDPATGEQIWSVDRDDLRGEFTFHEDTVLLFATLPTAAQ